MVQGELGLSSKTLLSYRITNLMAICIPKIYGGKGAELKTYMLAAAEIGSYCGATALTFNMHVSSCLWTGYLADNIDMDKRKRQEHESMRANHYKRIKFPTN